MSQGPQITSVVFAGVGGQGILLASEIMARTAMIADFDVKTNEVHGMAQRGGSVIAQIRYGQEVFSPLVPDKEARILCGLERIKALRYRHYLAADGWAVVSDQVIVPVTVSMGHATYPSDARERLHAFFPNLLYINALEMAQSLGNARAANTIMLGAVAAKLDLPKAAWEQAIQECVKSQYLSINIKAFECGYSFE
ncbi:MAG: indolepyruvate oxidoreductase subunit beta [Spartobacteria bacterium]|nr:indolepyruvate oxidoreductase subunit beta [Spartobacteria bacterium]